MTDFLPDFATAFVNSACIGAWAHDPATNRLTLSPALARLLTLSRKEASGALLDVALARIEPEDALRLESVLQAAGQDGCLFEAEVRTRRGAGGPRWLRLTGRCARDPASGLRATQGLAFDLTEYRAGGPSDRFDQHRANRLANHAVAMKALVAGLRNPPLARLVDEVAVEVGHEVARRLRGTGGRPH